MEIHIEKLVNLVVMTELLEGILQKHRKNGIDFFPPAAVAQVNGFEKKIGFSLPSDFEEFYSICNGFSCMKDLFNFTPLQDIRDYEQNWFYFSEYMIFSDTWGLRITVTGEYEIFNGSYPAIAMTSSLTEFLKHFLKGNVFDEGGLYEWMKELGID